MVYKLSGQKAAAFDEKIGTVLSTKPIWRNVRRNGFKIEVFAISLLFSAHQFNHVFPGGFANTGALQFLLYAAGRRLLTDSFLSLSPETIFLCGNAEH